jgi:hypothetical protein
MNETQFTAPSQKLPQQKKVNHDNISKTGLWAKSIICDFQNMKQE